MSVKVGINGFGRIGRLIVRAGIDSPDLEFVAVNDLTDAKTLAHLFKYDSAFGIYPGEVTPAESAIKIRGKTIQVLSSRDPASLPWKDLGVRIVIESTGKFTDPEKAKAHITAGARKVIISAPAKGEAATFCMGINEGTYNPAKHHVISNASCTTNCLAPMAKVLHDNFTILNGLMTTIHSYTNDQPILDFPHKDLRRGRAGAVSLIPTSTGAAKAIGLVIPELEGKMNGVAIRVPTPDVSLVDLTVNLAKSVTKEQVNEAFKKASQGVLKGYIEYCEKPLVSKDFLGNPASCIFDSPLTNVIDGKLVKVFGWYDNEWGYTVRTVELAAYVAQKGL